MKDKPKATTKSVPVREVKAAAAKAKKEEKPPPRRKPSGGWTT